MMESNKRLGRGLQDFSHLFLSKAADKAPEKPDTITPPERLAEAAPKIPYAVAITAPRRSLANTFVTGNLYAWLLRKNVSALVVNADLSFPSISLLSALQPEETGEQRGDADLQAQRGAQAVRVITLDRDITMLSTPWPDEKHPLIEQLTRSAREADVILINTSVGFSSNAKAIFKAADEILLISGPDPAQLIDTYSIIKTITQLAREAPLGIIMVSGREEALRGFAKLHEACQEFLEKALTFYGTVPFDPDIAGSIRHKIPLVQMKPDGLATQCLQDIGEFLLNSRIEHQQERAGEAPLFVERLLFMSGQTMDLPDPFNPR